MGGWSAVVEDDSAELEELVVETVSFVEVVVAEGEVGVEALEGGDTTGGVGVGVEALEEGDTTGGVGVDEEGRFGANLGKLDTELVELEALGGYE